MPAAQRHYEHLTDESVRESAVTQHVSAIGDGLETLWSIDAALLPFNGLGKPLATYTSAGGNVDVTSIIDVTKYRVYRVIGYVRPGTNGALILVQTSSNNGSSWDTGASDYIETIFGGAAPSIGLTGAVSNGYYGANFDFTLQVGIGSVGTASLFAQGFYHSSATGLATWIGGGGFRVGGSAVNAFRILPSVGVLDFVEVRVYPVGVTA